MPDHFKLFGELAVELTDCLNQPNLKMKSLLKILLKGALELTGARCGELILNPETFGKTYVVSLSCDGEFSFLEDQEGHAVRWSKDVSANLLVFPLNHGGEVLGSLRLMDGPLNSVHRALFEQFLILAISALVFTFDRVYVEKTKQQITALSLAAKASESLLAGAILNKILKVILKTIDWEIGAIYLLDEHSRKLYLKAYQGLSASFVEKIQVMSLGEGFTGKAAEYARLFYTGKSNSGRLAYPNEVQDEGMKVIVSIPMTSRGKVLGVVNLASRYNRQLSAQDRLFMSVLGTTLGVGLENTRLYEKTARDFRQTVAVLSAAVDAHDPYTAKHSANVARYAVAIAKQMGLESQEIENLELAALLHDIGKIGIPDAILRKPTVLEPHELSIIQKHPVIAVNMLSKAPGTFEQIIPIVRHHHERFDGTGYPDGLMGARIPIGAAILAVADAFDAMTSDRPYRPALALAMALEELKNGAGTQFHPQVVSAFSRIIKAIHNEMFN